MERSIDEILNEADSDEEPFEFNLAKVELLLQEEDDDFDSRLFYPQNQLQLLTLTSDGELDLDFHPKQEIHTEQPFSEESHSFTSEDILLGAFELARKKELKFLSQGNNEIQPVLKIQEFSLGMRPKFSKVIFFEVDKVSNQLKKNEDYKQYGPGVATTVHCHPNFIAIGTSRGQILVFDLNHEIKLVLGESSSLTSGLMSITKSFSVQSEATSITAIDSVSTGSILISGNSNGEICIWDTSTGTLMKKITDLHARKIVRLHRVGFGTSEGIIKSSLRRASMEYAGGASYLPPPDSSFNFISVDSVGTVNYVRFSKQLLRGFYHEANRIFHGRAGVVHDVASLDPLSADPSETIAPPCNDPDRSTIPPNSSFVAFTFNSPFKSFIVQTQPVVRVASGWLFGEGLLDASTSTARSGLNASMSWGWFPIPLSPSESESKSQEPQTRSEKLSPCVFRVCGSVLDSLYIQYTAPSQALNLDSPTSTTLSLALQALKPTDQAEGYSFPPLWSRSFEGENLVAVRVLGGGQGLVAALSLASVFFLNFNFEEIGRCSISPRVTESLSSHLSSDFPDCLPNFITVSGQSFLCLNSCSLYSCHLQLWEEKAEELLGDGKYVEALTLVLENNDKDMFDSHPNLGRYVLVYLEHTLSQACSLSSKSSGSDLRGLFSTIATVSAEYCLYGNRLDLLFNDVWMAFEGRGQLLPYFEALEPLLLTRRLPQLPLDIIRSFFETCAKNQRLSLLERCVCCLDPEQLHSDFVLRFLLDKGMWSAFLYVRGFGGQDFMGAFQILFFKMLELTYESGSASPARRRSVYSLQGFPSPDQADLGYKLLLFLHDCIQQQLFPRGGSFEIEIHHLLQLFGLLSQEEFKSRPSFKEEDDLSLQSSEREFPPFPYMHFLFSVDPSAAVHVMCLGMSRIQSELQQHSSSVCTLIGHIHSFLASFQQNSGKLMDYFFRSSLDCLSRCSSPLPDDLLASLVKFTAQPSCPCSDDPEAFLLPFAECVGKHQGQRPLFRAALETHNFWRADLELLASLSDSDEFYSLPPSLRWRWFRRAVDFYLERGREQQAGDSIPMATDLIFSFIHRSFQIFSGEDRRGRPESPGLHQELLPFLSKLADLDLPSTEQLCVRYLTGHAKDILSMKAPPRVQCLILTSILTNLNLEDPSARSLSDLLGPEGLLAYLDLLCSHEPSMVYPFLLAHDCYSIDACLALVRKKGLLDATSLLVEKTGDHLAALDLLLQDLSEKITSTKQALEVQTQSQGLDVSSGPSKKGAKRPNKLVLNEEDMALLSHMFAAGGSINVETVSRLSLLSTLSDCVLHVGSLCARNSSKSNSSVWFKAFDYLLFERQSFRGSDTPLVRVMSLLVGELVQGLMELMKDIVPAQEIVRRITLSFAQSAKLGEMRDMLRSMLDSLGYETQVSEVLLRVSREDLRTMLLSKTTMQRSGRRFEKEGRGLEMDDQTGHKRGGRRLRTPLASLLREASYSQSSSHSEAIRPCFRSANSFSRFVKALSSESHAVLPSDPIPRRTSSRRRDDLERERSLSSAGWDSISQTITIDKPFSAREEGSTHSLSSLLTSDESLRNQSLPSSPVAFTSSSTDDPSHNSPPRQSFISRSPSEGSEFTSRNSFFADMKPAHQMVAGDGDFTTRSSLFREGDILARSSMTSDNTNYRSSLLREGEREMLARSSMTSDSLLRDVDLLARSSMTSDSSYRFSDLQNEPNQNTISMSDLKERKPKKRKSIWPFLKRNKENSSIPSTPTEEDQIEK